MKSVLQVPWKLWLIIITSSLLYLSQGETQNPNNRFRKWRGTLLALSHIADYNKTAWPIIYEDRNEKNVDCQTTLDPEAADK